MKLHDFLKIDESNENDILDILIAAPYFFRTKRDGDLTMILPTKETDFTQPIISKSFGIIINDNYDVVCYSNSYIYEVASLDVHELQTMLSLFPTTDLSNYHIQSGIDGTICKLFYYNDEWRLSTRRCIDAHKSFWNETSFYNMFDECSNECGLDYNKLNKEKFYVFTICHPQNRIVVPYTKKMLYHIDTIDKKTLNPCNDDIGIQKPQEYHFETVSELYNTLYENNDHTFFGYILTDTNGEKIKIENPSYSYVKWLKGNIPNMIERYLYLKLHNLHEMFLYYYPEYTTEANFVNTKLCKLYSTLYTLYIEKYIKHSKIQYDKKYHLFLKHAHNLYKMRGTKIEYKDICNIVMNCSFKRLAFVLNIRDE